MRGVWVALLCVAAAHAEEFRLHAYHATTLQMECNTCHVPVQKDSVTLRRPEHTQCVMCHAMSGSADLLPYPRDKGQLLSEFSHARHIDSRARADHTGFRADCIHCHKV